MVEQAAADLIIHGLAASVLDRRGGDGYKAHATTTMTRTPPCVAYVPQPSISALLEPVRERERKEHDGLC